MAAWLYQMAMNTEDPWSPNEYRAEVWQGRSVTWPMGKITPRQNGAVSKGDIVVFFFTKSNNAEPGIYGWGIVLEFVESQTRARIKFEVAPPSDLLKMNICWGKEVESWIDAIRGGMPMGTMWGISLNEFNQIKQIVLKHIHSVVAAQ